MTHLSFNAINAFNLLDELPVGVVVHDANTQIVYINRKALQVLRMTAEQALGKVALDFQWKIVDSYRQSIPVENFPVNIVLSSGMPVTGVSLGIIDSTRVDVTWLTVNAVPVMNADGGISQVIVTFTENTYERADIPFKEVVDSAQDVILITEAYPLQEPGPRIVYVNKAFSDLTGYKPKKVIGRSPRFLQRDDADPKVKSNITQALAKGLPVREIIYNYSKDGDGYWLDMQIVPLKNAAGEVAFFAAIERDVTAQKRAESELHYFAHHDALTRLPNRRLLLDHLQRSLLLSKRSGQHSAVLFIDLNKFKQLNDMHGHDAGDACLVEVAARLKQSVRDGDVVARLGGDEFIVLIDNLGTDFDELPGRIARIVDKITCELSRVYVLGSIKHFGSASIGVRMIDSAVNNDPVKILIDADMAMYFVKSATLRRIKKEK